MKLLPICTWLLCLLLFIVCLGSECGTTRRIVKSKRDLIRIREARSTFPGPCATRLPRGKRSLPGIDRRSPRLSQAGESSPGRRRAVYFTGRGDQLRLKPNAEVPRGNFTLEMWIKPEGGQRSPAVIGGLICLILTCIIFTYSLQKSSHSVTAACPRFINHLQCTSSCINTCHWHFFISLSLFIS